MIVTTLLSGRTEKAQPWQLQSPFAADLFFYYPLYFILHENRRIRSTGSKLTSKGQFIFNFYKTWQALTPTQTILLIYPALLYSLPTITKFADGFERTLLLSVAYMKKPCQDFRTLTGFINALIRL